MTLGKIDEEMIDVKFTKKVKDLEGAADSLTQQLADTAKKSEVDDALAPKANRDEVFLKGYGININGFDEPTRKAILEAQGIDVNYVLGDGNVTPRNTTFFKTSKNLFDKLNVSLNQSVSSTTGELVTFTDYFTSDFIPVLEKTTYTRNHGWSHAYYDANKTFISGVGTPKGKLTFTTPDNAAYLRVSEGLAFLDSFQVEIGSESTSYEGFKILIPEQLIEDKPFDIEKVPENIIPPKKTTFFKPGKNLFDKNSVAIGKSVSSTDGRVVSLSDTNLSDYIPIEPSTTYSRSHGWTAAFYDANKKFISGIGSNLAGKLTFETPLGAKYVLLSVKQHDDLGTVQLEKGQPTEYEDYKLVIKKSLLEDEPFDIEKLPIITPKETSFFETGKNLFDKSSVLKGYSVSSSTGELAKLTEHSASDFIPVESQTLYTRSAGRTIAFYDSDKVYISGIGAESAGKLTFETPNNAKYLRFSVRDEWLDITQLEKGNQTTSYENFRYNLVEKYLQSNETGSKFKVKLSQVKLPRGLADVSDRNLSLVATKEIHSDPLPPDTIGYLYLDDSSKKFYYSSGKSDRPEFLFDWNSSLGDAPENYNVTITHDGDVIFIKGRKLDGRNNPIVYPSGNYTNPVIVDFGSELKPYAFLSDSGVCHDPTGSFFIFGDYAAHSKIEETNGGTRNIWKVTKPYTDKNNWVVKKAFKFVNHDSPPSNEPDNEIGHIHTVTRDFYKNIWYCTTGDIDRHCRVMQSIDNGETWSEVISNGQKWRNLGMIFTEDAAYWGTDARWGEHALYKVDRDLSTGVLDFSTTTKLVDLDFIHDQPQPTYDTCYMREPNGLLFLDRAEPRSDLKLDLTFWSFEYEKLFKLATFSASLETSMEPDIFRFGWGNLAATQYQPTAESGIICGSNTQIREFSLDVLGNSESNPVGNVKIEVYEVLNS